MQTGQVGGGGHLRCTAVVLQVGVGNSLLQHDMVVDGFRHVCNLDYSEVRVCLPASCAIRQ